MSHSSLEKSSVDSYQYCFQIPLKKYSGYSVFKSTMVSFRTSISGFFRVYSRDYLGKFFTASIISPKIISRIHHLDSNQLILGKVKSVKRILRKCIPRLLQKCFQFIFSYNLVVLCKILQRFFFFSLRFLFLRFFHYFLRKSATVFFGNLYRVSIEYYHRNVSRKFSGVYPENVAGIATENLELLFALFRQKFLQRCPQDFF